VQLALGWDVYAALAHRPKNWSYIPTYISRHAPAGNSRPKRPIDTNPGREDYGEEWRPSLKGQVNIDKYGSGFADLLQLFFDTYVGKPGITSLDIFNRSQYKDL